MPKFYDDFKLFIQIQQTFISVKLYILSRFSCRFHFYSKCSTFNTVFYFSDYSRCFGRNSIWSFGFDGNRLSKFVEKVLKFLKFTLKLWKYLIRVYFNGMGKMPPTNEIVAKWKGNKILMKWVRLFCISYRLHSSSIVVAICLLQPYVSTSSELIFSPFSVIPIFLHNFFSHPHRHHHHHHLKYYVYLFYSLFFFYIIS